MFSRTIFLQRYYPVLGLLILQKSKIMTFLTITLFKYLRTVFSFNFLFLYLLKYLNTYKCIQLKSYYYTENNS